ncbi:DoxX family protein [Brevundimonas naejangsanensis]|uniref:DoxX family protein n=1 Tax=Brevundimonas naejangsanensis TaxID=588932 RepID=UPI0026EE7A99|nr:DoxX family protein [Brevundimonas naejangsanensis]
MTPSIEAAWRPRALAALRIMTGLLFLARGLVKLAGFPEGAQAGQQELLTLFGIGAVLESVGGALLVLGLFTRPAAFVLSGMMAVAYLMFHAPAAFHPLLGGAILFSFILLYLVSSGPGAWSLDGLRRRTSAAPAFLRR